MSTKIVDDGLIQKALLYKPVFWLFRLDVLPFVVLYSIFFSFALSASTTTIHFGLIMLPILFSVHLFLFLMAQWSVRVRCALGYKLVNDVAQAEIVHVAAAQNAGMDRLVKLMANNYFSEAKSVMIMDKAFSITRERLDFQKVVYNFDSDRNTFARLDYPSSASTKHILEWRGHAAAQDVGLSLMRWGSNEYDIPIPNFLDLYLVSSTHHNLAVFYFTYLRFRTFYLWRAGSPRRSVLRVPSAVPVPVEPGRLLVLQRVHPADAYVLRRHDVQAAPGQSHHAAQHAPPTSAHLRLQSGYVGGHLLGHSGPRRPYLPHSLCPEERYYLWHFHQYITTLS